MLPGYSPPVCDTIHTYNLLFKAFLLCPIMSSTRAKWHLFPHQHPSPPVHYPLLCTQCILSNVWWMSSWKHSPHHTGHNISDIFQFPQISRAFCSLPPRGSFFVHDAICQSPKSELNALPTGSQAVTTSHTPDLSWPTVWTQAPGATLPSSDPWEASSYVYKIIKPNLWRALVALNSNILDTS